MIKRLRIKFILIAMASFSAALIVILGYINVSNYRDVLSDTGSRIEMIERIRGERENRPSDSPEPPALPDDPDDSPLNGFPFFRGDGFPLREAEYDSRYFSVEFSSDGETVSADVSNIASVSEEEAVETAQKLLSQGKTDGITSSFRYLALTEDKNTVYIFFDCSRELSTFYSFFRTSIFVSLAALTIVFVLLLFLSKIAIKPVATSYEKQKRFITDASHELKTPLAIISAANEVTEMETGETEWTRSIDKQIKRMTSLTEKLVMLSRMDEEGYAPNRTEFSLSDAIGEAAHSFDAVAEHKNKKYSVDIENGIRYTGDESALKQLASLLIDNAMKYSDEEGYIGVSLKKSGKNCELKVQNSVEHIEKGRHDELFERFYRSDESRSSSTGGHGIGLSVAKAITQSHRGKISAVSPDGKSIVFTVLL